MVNMCSWGYAPEHIIQTIVAILLGIIGILIGVSAVIAAFQGEGWGVGIFGAFSIVLSMLLLFNSLVGGQVLVWLTALLLVIQGGYGVIRSFMKS